MDKICRACLSKPNCETNVNIFSKTVKFKGNQSKSVSLTEMLEFVTSVKVSNEDNKPSFVCNPCYKNLIEAFNFKTQYQRANSILESFKQANENKTIDTPMDTFDSQETSIDLDNDIYISELDSPKFQDQTILCDSNEQEEEESSDECRNLNETAKLQNKNYQGSFLKYLSTDQNTLVDDDFENPLPSPNEEVDNNSLRREDGIKTVFIEQVIKDTLESNLKYAVEVNTQNNVNQVYILPKTVVNNSCSEVPLMSAAALKKLLKKCPKCPICGDKNSGIHYGVLVCNACRDFFGRFTRMNEGKTVTFKCKKDFKCVIDKRSRKRCVACRYYKCLANGMRHIGLRKDEKQQEKHSLDKNSEHLQGFEKLWNSKLAENKVVDLTEEIDDPAEESEEVPMEQSDEIDIYDKKSIEIIDELDK